MRTLIGLALWSLPQFAAAQTFTLELSQQAIDAGVDEAALETALTSAIGDNLKLGSQAQHDQFINSMVEAAAISAKGMGVDYASNIEKFVFGGSIASGVQEAGFSFNRGKELLPKGGFGAQITLMAGVNLGMGGKEHGVLDRFRLYANGMAMRLPSDRNFGGQMANAAGHVQIKLIEGNHDAKVVEWGGLDLTSGFEYSAYAFDLRQDDIPIDAPMGSQGTVTWTANGKYNINSDVLSVPVELSTNLRIFVITAYLGGAYDYNAGVGTSAANLSGPLDGKLLAPNGDTVDGDIGIASVYANADGISNPNVFRIFVGAQANILVLKVFGHLNVEPLDGAVGGHVGLRVAI